MADDGSQRNYLRLPTLESRAQPCASSKVNGNMVLRRVQGGMDGSFVSRCFQRCAVRLSAVVSRDVQWRSLLQSSSSDGPAVLLIPPAYCLALNSLPYLYSPVLPCSKTAEQCDLNDGSSPLTNAGECRTEQQLC